MRSINHIEALLRADAECAKNSMVLLKDLRPSVIDAFERAAELFVLFDEEFKRSNFERVHADEFEDCGKQLGIRPRELDRRIKAGDLDPLVVRARNARLALMSRQAQKYAFQLAWRAFRWGVTDLRRLRVTAACGYMRQQAEAAGLIGLFADQPGIAKLWLSPTEDHKKLFRETQKAVRDRMEQFNLAFAYDYGSAAAMHATFATGVRASRFGSEDDHHVVVEVGDQEFNPRDPFLFHLAVAYFLRTQQRTFRAIAGICQDLPAGALAGAMDAFDTGVDDIWWTLARRYADRIAAMQRFVDEARAGAGNVG